MDHELRAAITEALHLETECFWHFVSGGGVLFSLASGLGLEIKINNNNNSTCLKWGACNNQHKSQFFTAGPTVKRIDKVYYIIQVSIK